MIKGNRATIALVLSQFLFIHLMYGEVLQGSLSIVGRQPNIIGASVAIYAQALDRTDNTQQYSVDLCIDDSTKACISGNVVHLTGNCTATTASPGFPINTGPSGVTNCGLAAPANHIYWPIPSSAVNGINLRDGVDHLVYAWARSKIGSANDIMLDFMGGGGTGTGNAPFHLRWDAVHSNLFPQYAASTNTPVALNANNMAVFADTSQAFSVGSTGSTYCTSGTTATGSTAIKVDGIVGYYAQQHSIPCANIYEVTLGAIADSMSQASFISTFGTILTGMPSTIQYYSVGWHRPNIVILTRGTGTRCEPLDTHDCTSFVGFMIPMTRCAVSM